MLIIVVLLLVTLRAKLTALLSIEIILLTRLADNVEIQIWTSPHLLGAFNKEPKVFLSH